MAENEAEIQLQEVLIKTYFSNMEFLKECDFTLYERVQNLSFAIEENLYQERYHLEFIKEQGEFDIFDEHTNTYMYKRKPKQYINRSVHSINFDKKGSFTVFEPVFYSSEVNLDTITIEKDEIQDQKLGALKLHKDIRPYLEILNVDIMDKTKKYKHINKFMFIGTLLGRHIASLVKKVKAKHYFVHEPNLEIFRLSLFVVDYTLLLSNNATVNFSIMDDDIVLENKLYEYYKLHTWENHTIKFHTTDYNIENSFESVMNALIPAKPTLYGYNMMLYCVIRNLSKRINHYKFLYCPFKKPLEIFQEKPVMYVCAGPSLEDNIAWLKQHQDKFIVATIGAVYNKLLTQDILPDIIFTLDGDYSLLNKLQFDEETTQKIQDCIVIASAHTDERILKRFNPKNLYLFETMLSFKLNSLPLKGHSIGEMAYRMLLELGVSELYLLGTDLAIHQQKGTSHSSNANSSTKSFDLQNIKSSFEKKSFSLRDELVKVKGNLYSEVYTTRVLNTSLIDYSKVEKKSWQKVFNLCNHGAFISNTVPMSIDNININQFECFKTNQKIFLKRLNEQVQKVSSLQLSQEDLVFLEKLYEYINQIKNNIETCKQKEYQSYDEFKETYTLLFQDVLQVKDIFLNESFSAIISLFYAVIISYIDYAFNDPKVKNEKNKVNQVAQVWLDSFSMVVKDFQGYLQQVIKQ